MPSWKVVPNILQDLLGTQFQPTSWHFISWSNLVKTSSFIVSFILKFYFQGTLFLLASSALEIHLSECKATETDDLLLVDVCFP
jgi:hypothetical protein